MSHQVLNALDAVDQSMRKLNTAYDAIKIRREFFAVTYRQLTKAVATLSVEVADHAGAFE